VSTCQEIARLLWIEGKGFALAALEMTLDAVLVSVEYEQRYTVNATDLINRLHQYFSSLLRISVVALLRRHVLDR
jgi:hypothetical protein